MAEGCTDEKKDDVKMKEEMVKVEINDGWMDGYMDGYNISAARWGS